MLNFKLFLEVGGLGAGRATVEVGALEAVGALAWFEHPQHSPWQGGVQCVCISPPGSPAQGLQGGGVSVPLFRFPGASSAWPVSLPAHVAALSPPGAAAAGPAQASRQMGGAFIFCGFLHGVDGMGRLSSGHFCEPFPG